MTNWAELEHRGYVHLPGFLPQADRDLLWDDYASGQPAKAYPFGFKPLGRRALQRARQLLTPAMGQIAQATSIRVDSINFLTLSHYVTTDPAARSLHWHQDFDLDYRLTGDHLDYLNFWMPLHKPRADSANLAIIPRDTLQVAYPEAARRAQGLGGARWVVEQGVTTLYLGLDATQPEARFEVDLERLAVVPQVCQGDLLVLRGDTLHRTQDCDTLRVAASVRATGLHKRITRARLQSLQEMESLRTRQQLEPYFDQLGVEEMTLGQLLELARGPASPC